jgi:membrane protease YdiL (CAAX protease family)
MHSKGIQQGHQGTSVKSRSALMALLLLVPAPSLGVFFAMMFEPTRGTSLGQAIYGASKLWILALPVLWYLLIEKGRMSISPVRSPNGLWMGLFAGIAISAAIGGAYLLFGRALIPVEQMRQAAVANGIGTPGRYLALVIYLTLVNSLLEEYVWRWFVYRRCEAVIGRKPIAVAAAALLFTLHHVLALRAQTTWSVTLLASGGLLIGACAWSWLYARYRSIWPGYISHVLADAAVFIVGWVVLFGNGDAATQL